MSARTAPNRPALPLLACAIALSGCVAHYRAGEVRASFDRAAGDVEASAARARRDLEDKQAGPAELQAAGVDTGAPGFTQVRRATDALAVTVEELARVAGQCAAARGEVDRLMTGREEVRADDPVIDQVKKQQAEVHEIFGKVRELEQVAAEQSRAVDEAARAQNAVALRVADGERAVEKAIDVLRVQLVGARAALDQAGWSLDSAGGESEQRRGLIGQARAEWAALAREDAAGQDQLTPHLQKAAAHAQEIRRLAREAAGR